MHPLLLKGLRAGRQGDVLCDGTEMRSSRAVRATRSGSPGYWWDKRRLLRHQLRMLRPPPGPARDPTSKEAGPAEPDPRLARSITCCSADCWANAGMAAMVAANAIVQSQFDLRISLTPHAYNPTTADIMR